MTICHERRLIFIHIPKNAGTSIIGSMGVENIFIDKTIDEYKEHYVEYWDNYKKFTVIRDPIDRFISAYKCWRMCLSHGSQRHGKDDNCAGNNGSITTAVRPTTEVWHCRFCHGKF